MRNAFFTIFALVLILRDVRPQSSSTTTKTDDFIKTTINISEEKSSPSVYYRCLPSVRANVIARCPAEYADENVMGKCEKGSFPLDDEDISIVVPVTGRESGIHYANRYCALCHNDSSAEQWELNISWPAAFTLFGSHRNRKTDEQILSTLRFDETLKSYTVDDGDKPLRCAFRPVQPHNVALIRCTPKIIRQCPSVYRGAKDCDRFAGHVVCDWPNYAFVNAECARCNNFTLNSLDECDFRVMKSDPVKTLFRLKKSSSNACSVPAIAKYYC